MKTIEIRNAKHFASNETVTIYIENGVFTDSISGEPDEVIDANGLTVFPGLVDMHCHLREPGIVKI